MKATAHLFPTPAELAELRRRQNLPPAMKRSANPVIGAFRKIFTFAMCLVLGLFIFAGLTANHVSPGAKEMYGFLVVVAVYVTIGWRIDLAIRRYRARRRAERTLLNATKKNAVSLPAFSFQPGAN